MISRARKPAKGAAKVPKPEGYRRLLRWAALPVTDRRWAAPLSAVALGFGLFVGVAIGPGAAGSFATGAAQVIEIPGFIGGTDSGGDGGEGGGPSTTASSAGAASGGGGGSIPTESALPSFAPSELESEPSEAPAPSPSPAEPPSESEEPEAAKETLAGVVLHVNPVAASYTIAEPGGTLDVLHTAKPPRPGAKLSVPVRLLANGTFAEAGTRIKEGERSRATFSGIVTYIDATPAAPAYTVSARGVSVLVHVHPDATGAAPILPALGAFAKVAVDIEPQPPASASASPAIPAESLPGQPSDPPPPPDEPSLPPGEPAQPAPVEAVPAPPAPAEPAPAPPLPSCVPNPGQPPSPVVRPIAILWQRQLSAPGAPFTASDFAGIVKAICPETAQLLISADDIGESGHDLLFTVPSGIDTTKLKAGQAVLAKATIGADGALALTGLASDDRLKGAEDSKATQGELTSQAKASLGATGPAAPRPFLAAARAAPTR